ncbi:MAG: gephyrin-like molybdotransferase receptor GlpR [Mycobacteriaceae bacterium]
MPSSLIFVVLVAAWLAVLVPMVAKHRQEIRRTSDAALAARVLHHGGSDERLRRPGPAAGHRSDPDWLEDDHEEAAVQDEMLDEYADSETSRRRSGRGGYNPEADAVARMARYAFRRHAVLGLLIGAVLTAIVAAVLFTGLWWLHVAIDLGLVGYLVYLRRQVRIEEDIRQRRMSRMGRARLGVDSKVDEEYDAVPRRLRKPGAVVLEIDDEDPAFAELDGYAPEMPMELPRASGQ